MLGKLILKGMKRGRSRKRRRGPSSRKKSRPGRPLEFIQPISKEKALVVQEKPVVSTETKIELKTDQRDSKTLFTTDLIRPNEKIRSSMEGFFLDQRSENTRKAYGKDLKRFIKFLLVRREQKGTEKLTRHVFVAYKDWLLSEGLEHTTIDRHLATLRGLLGWFVEDDLIEKNPVERVRFLNPKRMSKTQGFTDEEVKKILQLPNLHTRTGAQHYAILMLLFYCGLRRSEICEIRTSNLSVERGIHILQLRGKGNKERIIPLRLAVWNAIKYFFVITRKDPGKDQYLFSPIRNNRTGKFNKPLDSSLIFYVVKKYAKKAGIARRVSPHSCRATAISNARDHDVADRAIQEFAGWASPEMITRYDKRKTAIEKSAALSINYGQEKDPEKIPGWDRLPDEEIPNEV